MNFIDYCDMDFGTEHNSKCGICNAFQDEEYWWNSKGDMTGDIICFDCDEIWKYSEKLDGYVRVSTDLTNGMIICCCGKAEIHDEDTYRCKNCFCDECGNIEEQCSVYEPGNNLTIYEGRVFCPDCMPYDEEDDNEKGTESEFYCDIHTDRLILHDGDGGFYCEECDEVCEWCGYPHAVWGDKCPRD